MNSPKVFLTGGDSSGWALDWEISLTRRALDGIVDFSGLEDCDVVHSVWWEAVRRIPEERLDGKRVVSYVPGEPFRMLQAPDNGVAMRRVGKWIGGSSEAIRQFRSIGVESVYIPFLVDLNVFHPLPAGDEEVERLRRRWGIPEGKYLIGSFQRDTDGTDLRSPKLEKGPDVIAEILRALSKGGYPIHVVLAGPRRHWLRDRLSRYGVPYTFVGQNVDGDDYPTNILPRSELNLLNNLIDLYLVGSRSEGGPNAILEVAASRCKVVSTRVGMVEDVLDPACIYDAPATAVELIARDIAEASLESTVETHFNRAQSHHLPEAVARLFRSLYETIDAVPPYRAGVNGRSKSPVRQASTVRRVALGVGRRARRRLPAVLRERLTVGLWHDFRKPPWGGGNQFMLALRKALRKKGVRTVENRFAGVDAHIVRAVHFDVARFEEAAKRKKPTVIHRVAGPIELARGFDREQDELCFRLNARLAFATVLQSAWSYQQYVKLGYAPVNPVIIHNAADPEIFHGRSRVTFVRGRKLRLISSSWSDNPRKGGHIYKWLDEHLDWARFDYTFVGNTQERFTHIRHVPPVDSQTLADLLRQHDIFIFASGIEAGSNALVEAISCGLPVLYNNSSSNPEIVGHGGLPFTDTDEIAERLDALERDYEMYQSLVTPPSIDEVAQAYVDLARLAMEST